MKKILYLCGTSKSEKEYCSSFVHNRLLQLSKRKEYTSRNICVQPIPSRALSFALKKIKKVEWQVDWDEYGKFDNIVYEYIKANVNLYQWYNFTKIGEIYYKAILGKIKKENYDLIHAHWAYPMGFVAYKISVEKKIPYVVSCHGVDIDILPFRNKKIKSKIIMVLENAKKVIFVSDYLLKKAVSFGYSGKNAIIIPNGYDSDTFRKLDKNFLREKYSGEFDFKNKIVGFVGNLKCVKRVDKFLEMFSRIAEKYPRVEFLIVGDGELRDWLENQLKDFKVRFTGSVSHKKVAEYMNLMDIMILPSRNEGFGCVVLEARACGVPVVASDVGGIPEALGNGGILVNSDVENFEKTFATEVLKLLISNPEVIEERNIIKKYTWDEIVRREAELYYNSLKNLG